MTCCPSNKPLVRTAHDCETGLLRIKYSANKIFVIITIKIEFTATAITVIRTSASVKYLASTPITSFFKQTYPVYQFLVALYVSRLYCQQPLTWLVAHQF